MTDNKIIILLMRGVYREGSIRFSPSVLIINLNHNTVTLAPHIIVWFYFIKSQSKLMPGIFDLKRTKYERNSCLIFCLDQDILSWNFFSLDT